MERVRKIFHPIHRYDSLSEESKIIIDLIWPDGDFPKGSCLHRTAKSNGVGIDEYLLFRFNSKNPKGYQAKKLRQPMSDERRKQLSDYWMGRKKSPEQTENIRKAKLGENNPAYGVDRPFEVRKKTGEAISKTLLALKSTPKHIERRRKRAENVWLRTQLGYRMWRKEVFKRDNYICMKTGVRGGKLVAHHLWSYHSNDDLRLWVPNGVTLSDEAHREFHKIYGKKNNTVPQFEEWLGRPLPSEFLKGLPPKEYSEYVDMCYETYEMGQAMSDYDEDDYNNI